MIVQEVDPSSYALEQINTTFACASQALLTLDGEPLRYKDQSYFVTGIDDTHYDTMLFRTARQVGKSTALATRLIVPSVTLPNFKTLYVSPSFKQTKEFSQTRLEPFIQGSDWIRNFRLDKTCARGIEAKSFTNLSRMVFRYAFYTADRCRGLSAHLLCIDEIQDILWDNVPIIEQVLAHAKPPTSRPDLAHLYKKKIYSGTPKTYQNTIEKLWKDSTQMVWVVRCDACYNWNHMEERAIGKYGTICTKRTCRKPIDPRNGVWHMLKPDAPILGFHINQLMAPRKEWGPHGWINWQTDILDYQKRYDEVQFYNEVLGLPKDDAKRALSEGDILACCDSLLSFTTKPTPSTQTSNLYAGVDWGESNARTVLTIGGYFGTERFTVIFVKVYAHSESADPKFLVADIVKWLKLFNVVAVGADVGHGWGVNADLMQNIGIERVFPVRYTGSRAPRLVYAKKKHEWVANRSQVLGEMFMDIKRKKFRFPSWKQVEELSKDLLSIFTEYSGKLKELIYAHDPDEPDDWAHSLCYARLSAELSTGLYSMSYDD